MPMALDAGEGSGRCGEARPAATRRAISHQPSGSISTFDPDDRAEVAVETTTRPALVLATIQRWVTADDERTCPVCAPLHGQLFRNDEGPMPPLHRSCRCRRMVSSVEVTTRD